MFEMYYVEQCSFAILIQSTGDEKMSPKFCTKKYLASTLPYRIYRIVEEF